MREILIPAVVRRPAEEKVPAEKRGLAPGLPGACPPFSASGISFPAVRLTEYAPRKQRMNSSTFLESGVIRELDRLCVRGMLSKYRWPD